MEKRVDSLVFRRLTRADFDHIYHEGSHYERGGGQSYIDFPVADVAVNKWLIFLGPNTSVGAGNRPKWDFEINSLGLANPHMLKISNRRDASVSITSQKIHGRNANRVPAWHPDNDFPVVFSDNIVIYIVKTKGSDYWAGWFEKEEIPTTWAYNDRLKDMFLIESAGYIKFTEKLFIETTNSEWPFYFNAKSIFNEIPTQEDIETELELEDTSGRLQELIDSNAQPDFVSRLIKIRQRNHKLVRNLKALYEGKCQITAKTG